MQKGKKGLSVVCVVGSCIVWYCSPGDSVQRVVFICPSTQQELGLQSGPSPVGRGRRRLEAEPTVMLSHR